MYDPAMMRFTGRDPLKGNLAEPLTVHKYLYCGNDGINKVDLDGRWAITVGGSVSGIGSAGLLNGASQSSMASLINGGLGIHALMRQALIGLVALEVDLGIGGTAGAGIVFGQNDDGRAFFGSIFHAAAGGAVCNGGGAAMTLDIGFSPNAQNMQDLAGGFVEVGGSATVPAFVGSVFTGFSIGGSYAVGAKGIEMYTVNLGGGVNTGGVSWEGHLYGGGAIVSEW